MSERGRILLADDEETFLRSTADLLRREGYRCDCAPNAIVAAELLQAGEYDLLISDIRMPGNPDLKFIQEVPKIADGVPVILVTGYPTVDTAVTSFKLDVSAYLPKPVDFDELLTYVRKAIKGRQTYRLVRGLRQRLEEWHRETSALEEALSGQGGQDSPNVFGTFVNLAFRNIYGALADLRRLTGSFPETDAGVEPCHLLDCPKLASMTEALAETIRILKDTKSAFKSKELGELRKKLEKILNPGQAWDSGEHQVENPNTDK
jgi:DNA-binding NarL/FixJ family response regulator